MSLRAFFRLSNLPIKEMDPGYVPIPVVMGSTNLIVKLYSTCA